MDSQLPATQNHTMSSSSDSPLFIGLQSYTEAQATMFFGRDDEIDRLTNLVKAATLTIVFGKSGTGKTSLLNAGVFPRLRKDYCLPFRIRLQFDEDSPDLVTQIKKTLSEEIDKYGFTVESYPGDETLWEYFHREQLWKSVTPILIFDQFEEIFTLGKKSSRFDKKELDAFWQTLADLIENSIPETLKEKVLDGKETLDYSYKVSKLKALFSFREEFLPEFESITSRIPSLRYSRFRLLPMNGHQAYEVITKTWKENIRHEEAAKIVAFFAVGDEKQQPYELMTIEPSLLSQVCSLIEKERLREGRDKISAEFLSRYSKDIILRSIYNEALAESNRAVTGTPANNGLAVYGRPMNEFVEDKLITDEGYRTRYALSSDDQPLLPGINVLKSKYFVRDEGRSIELTHDVLTPLIKDDREARRKELSLIAARKKARRRVILITALALVATAGIWYFTTQEAIRKRDEAKRDQEKALTETRVLAMRIDSAKATLDSIGTSINNRKKQLENLTGDAGAPTPSPVDSGDYSNLLQQAKSDSLKVLSLNRQFADQRRDWETRDSINTAQLQRLGLTNLKSDSVNRDARMQIALLRQRIKVDSSRMVLLKRGYDELSNMYQKLFVDNPDIIPTANTEPPFDAAADTASLKLDLSYTKGKAPSNLKVYLIPFTSANRSIIRKAQAYEIRCDDMNLNKAEGRKLAQYANGNYVFLNVKPGKYFIKICAYYGGFYTYEKKESGNVRISREVAPPVQ